MGNIIPVIGKADTMTPEEVASFKTVIMEQIAAAKIKIYEFPEVEDGEEAERKENRRMEERVPFAVVGSNTTIEGEGGKKSRGRKYPWGVVDIENLQHCDFLPLRNMLIKTHLTDLRDVTNYVHYENFRCRKLAGVAGTDKVPNKNPLFMMEEEQKLADNERDLERRQNESTTRLQQLKKELEVKKAAYDQERADWESANNVTIEDLKRMSLESLDGKKKSKTGLSGVSFRMGSNK